MDGYEVIKKLKSLKKTQDIPVVFLTSLDGPGNELEGLSLGAIDYISKPFSPALLLRRIENHLLITTQREELRRYNENLQDMMREQTRLIKELRHTVISSLADVVEFRDDIMGGHVERIQNYLKIMVDQLVQENLFPEELSTWDMEYLIPSSQLHDVGKIMISEKILNKSGKLTPEEFEEIKKHPQYGVNIINRIMQLSNREQNFLRHAGTFAASHHEKWDGSGYPLGLAGEDIPLQGRLMGLVDVYDAVITMRPYKQPMGVEAAVQAINDGKGTHFDPLLVEVFQSAAPQFARISEHQNVHI
jgi:putative two-component system response regulator